MEERPPHAGAARDKKFAQCVLPEVEMLLRVATTLTARPDHAEQLVRDTLLHAHRMCDGYDGRQPRLWLLTLMHQARADRRRDDGSPPVGAAGHPGDPPVAGTTFHEVVDAELAALPVRYRRVVRLVDIDGLSYAEAAGLLGLREAAVTGRLRRARRRLRARLAAAGLVPGRGER